jgi:ribosomal protein S25
VLVYAPRIPLIEGITIELAMTEETEYRIDDGKGSWRRKGISVANRELHSVRETHVLSQVSDYRRFAPFPPNEDFGVRELAAMADINAALARKTLYVLSRIGVVVETEKKGNAKRYRLA